MESFLNRFIISVEYERYETKYIHSIRTIIKMFECTAVIFIMLTRILIARFFVSHMLCASSEYN